jgi:ethanolamine ammonia-lyase large subunit
MGDYSATIAGHRHVFGSLAELLAKASSPKTGDVLAGIAALSSEERVCARFALADVPLAVFLDDVVVPYEIDEVTRLIIDEHDRLAFAPVASLTVGEFRDWLLSDAADTGALAALSPGLTPEMVAAVSKLMSNRDLISVSRKCAVISSFRSTIGLPGRLSSRLQPNHPTDDAGGILASTIDGLLLASGDALIGLNPATDNLANCFDLLSLLDELRERYEIPTQTCVLTHITNAIQLMERGAPTDIVFQSVAGSEQANRGFGIDLALLREAHDGARGLKRGTIGDNVMYFETGQGSALSSDSHHGVDQQTIEARAYAVARPFRPLLVNTVVGFIGPEYIDGSAQIVRAGLEDHFCGKLMGLQMGCDVCYTNHASIDQNDMDVLATLLGVAGISFLIAVPGSDDVMLNYQSLSFHDILYLRSVIGLKPAPEFEDWLEKVDIAPGSRRDRVGADASPLMLELLLKIEARHG